MSVLPSVPLGDNEVQTLPKTSKYAAGCVTAVQGSASLWLPAQAGYYLEKVIY